MEKADPIMEMLASMEKVLKAESKVLQEKISSEINSLNERITTENKLLHEKIDNLTNKVDNLAEVMSSLGEKMDNFQQGMESLAEKVEEIEEKNFDGSDYNLIKLEGKRIIIQSKSTGNRYITLRHDRNNNTVLKSKDEIVFNGTAILSKCYSFVK